MNNTSDKDIEFDTDEFLEWAEEMAESEGVSTNEILDQTVSAYWVYTELQRTLNSVTDTTTANQSNHDPETGASTDGNDTIDQKEQPLPVGKRESISTSESEGSGVSESGPDYNDGLRKMSDERSQKELWQRLYDLSDKIDQNRRSQTERWVRLQDRVKSIEQEVNIMENENRGSRNSSENDAKMANVQSEIELLKEEIEQLNQSYEESLELRQEFKSRIEELERSQETIQSRVDDEFDSIESAFETALNRQEEFETRRSQLTDQIEDNTDTISSISEDKETLEAIRQTALQEGIEHAKCDYCDEDINISMLASPACPFCETPFNDIDPSGWNPLTSDVLTGAPRNLSADESEDFSPFLDEETDENGVS